MCLTVFIEDDDKLEGEERLSVSATSLDPSVSFDGNSTTVEIVDGDSMYKCCLKYYDDTIETYSPVVYQKSML